MSTDVAPPFGRTLNTTLAALLLWAMCYALAPVCHADGGEGPSRKSVLVLNSYHLGSEWAHGEVQGLLDTFRSSELDVELFIEQMDVLRQPQPYNSDQFLAQLRRRYAGQLFDLVVVTDDSALEFVAEHYREFFAGTPVVFSDVNHFDPERLPADMPVTGVMEHRDFLRTIHFARQQRPDAKQIVVFGNELDNHSGPRAAQRVLSELELDIPVRQYNDLAIEQIREVAAGIPAQDIVFVLGLASDSQQRLYSYERVKAAIQDVLDAAIFDFWSLGIEAGNSLGGVVNAPQWQGRAAAQLALRILRGEDARQIPVIRDAPTRYMINYAVMRALGANAALLPDDTIFIDRQPSFYSEYKALIWSTVVVVFGLLLIITILLLNIQRRLRAEQALRASEARFRSIFEFAPVGVAMANGSDGAIVAANPAMQHLVGYSEDELRGMSFKDFTHPDDAEKDVSQYHAMLGGRLDHFAMQKRYIRKDGGIVWADLTVSAIRDEQGSPVAAVGMAADISERRQAEEALRTSVTRLQTVITGAPIVLFSYDLRGVFTLSEGEGLRSMGLTAGEVVGKSAFDMYADQPEVLTCIRRSIDGETFTESLALAGSTYLAYHTPLLDRSGEQEGVIGVLVDITEQAHAEEALRRLNEELEQRVEQRTEELVRSEKMASLGALVAGVSHELSTPLGSGLTVATALAERVQMLSMQYEQGTVTDAMLQSFLTVAEEASELLARTITQSSELIQNFKKMAVDQTSAKRRKFDFAETVNEVLATLKFQFKGSRYALRLDLPSDVGMDSFPGALGQVLINLVNNAVTHAFTEQTPGEVSVEARLIEPGMLRMIVADDGRGIAREDLPKLFDPFFTTRMGQGGSGLGLHIVYNIVNGILGGQIAVNSEPGHGARFVVDMPLIAPQTQPRSTAVGVSEETAPASG